MGLAIVPGLSYNNSAGKIRKHRTMEAPCSVMRCCFCGFCLERGMNLHPEEVLTDLRRRIPRQWVICFASAVVFGLLAHIFKLTNFIPNWDSLLNLYTDQNKTELGRCFLMEACSVSSYYDLPWINGLLSLLYIAASSVCVVSLFEVKKTIPLVLIGGLMATFPTVTSTFAYMYTADGYFLALLCVCIATILVTRSRRYLLPAGALIAFGMGVYQAYVTFAMVLMLLILVDRLVFQKVSPREFFALLARFLGSGIVGAVGYWGALKLITVFSGVELSQYQSIDSAFSLERIDLLKSLRRIAGHFVRFFFDLSQGVNLYIVLNLAMFLLIGWLFVGIVRRQKTAKEPWRMLALLCCVAAVPFAAFGLYLISADMSYHNVMTMSLCLIYLIPLICYDRMPRERTGSSTAQQWMVLVLTALTIYNFTLIANISYQKLYMAYERSYGVAVRMADRIEQLPQAKDCTKIAAFGCLPGAEAFSSNLPPDITGVTDSWILRKQDTSMGENVTQAMLRDYCGIFYEDTTEDEKLQIAGTEAYQQMPCWPEPGSIAAIDDVLVVKYSDEDTQ